MIDFEVKTDERWLEETVTEKDPVSPTGVT
jgi:hypothetical protein